MLKGNNIAKDSDLNISYKLLEKSLKHRGFVSLISVENNKEYVKFTHPQGQSWTTSTALVSYPFNNERLKEISDDKSLGYAWAKQYDVSEPETIKIVNGNITEQGEITDLLNRYDKLVVKPDGSFGSRGVTVGLTSLEQVISAVERARQIKQRYDGVLVQQQIAGNEFRFSVLNGDVVSVMLRENARIIGDGIRTVSELIQDENRAREKLNLSSMVRYPLVEEIIDDRSHITSDIILSKSSRLVLATSAMVSGGASVYEVSTEVHHSYKEIAQRLARGMNAGFVVVDLFVEDHRIAATSSNVFFNEFNRSPALKMYYASRNGMHVDVADMIASSIDTYLSKS